MQWPAPSASTTTIVYEKAHDGTTGDAVAGADVRICGPVTAGSMPCDSPLAEGVTSDAGYVALTLPTEDGTGPSVAGLQVRAFARAAGYLDDYYYAFFPLSQATDTYPFGLSPYFYTPSSIFASPGMGGIFVVVVDCQTHFAPGVAVTADNPSVVSTVPKTLGPSGAPTPTGVLFFPSVPPGNLALTATAPSGATIGRYSFYVNASALTLVYMSPQPSLIH